MRQALADGNNVAATAHKVKGELRNSRGVFTGTTLTAIDMVRTYLKAAPDVRELVFAWDSSPTWRHDFYPEYKANRTKKEDDGLDFPGQKARLQVVLSYFGIPQIQIDGMEADDIAGFWMRINTHPITFLSNDIDWLQVLQNPLHNIYRTLDKSFVTMDDFEVRSKGFKTIEDFVNAYGISGQSKDNIPGIVGVGPVKALQYLHGNMNPKLETYKKIKAWMEDPNGYERSLTLSKLGVVPEKYSKAAVHETYGNFNEEEIHRILVDYEAKGRLAKFDDYVEPFRRLDQYRKDWLKQKEGIDVGHQEAPGTD